MYIKIAFFINDYSSSNENITTFILAFHNQKHLNNISFIISPVLNMMETDLERMFYDSFKIIYITNNLIEELSFKHKINIFYYLTSNSTSKLITKNLPCYSVNCIHFTDNIKNNENIKGDINIYQSDFPTHSISLNSIKSENINNTELFQLFEKYVINPSSKIVPSFGVESVDSKTTTLFIGSKNEMFPVFKVHDFININNKTTTYKAFITCNWTDSKQLINDWDKMSKGNATWNSWFNLQLTCNHNEADFYIIINAPNSEHDLFVKEKTIVFRMEPYIETNKNFNHWLVNTDKSKFMNFMDHSLFRNNTEWWISKTYNDIIKLNPIKNNIISSVVSSQYDMEGHKLRINFIKFFQKHSIFEIDIFGYDNLHSFRNYKGPLPKREKDNGILPYKYHFASENSNITNYFTEKLIDAILGECLLFYWGCGNVEEFINPKAFIRLDLYDMKSSVETIDNAIKNNEWESRIDCIREEKIKIIKYLNFFPRVSSLIHINLNVEFRQIERIGCPVLGLKNIKSGHSIVEYLNPKILRNFINKEIYLFQIELMEESLYLWNQCYIHGKIFCILDCELKPNFIDHMTTVLSASIECPEWDIIVLYSSRYSEENRLKLPIIKKLKSYKFYSSIIDDQTNDNEKAYTGNESCSYIINPKGSKKMIEFVGKFGFIANMDEMLYIINEFFGINVYYIWKNITSPYKIERKNTIYIFRKDNDIFKSENKTFTLPFTDNTEMSNIILSTNKDI